MSGVTKLIDHIGSERAVPHLRREDARRAPTEPFPRLTPWWRCGIYGLIRNGKTVYIGSAMVPIRAIHAHALPGPAWMGHVDFDSAWIQPSHPDRVRVELRETRRRHGL